MFVIGTTDANFFNLKNSIGSVLFCVQNYWFND